MLLVQASERAPIRKGTIYVTPPDRHLIVSQDHIHLSRARRSLDRSPGGGVGRGRLEHANVREGILKVAATGGPSTPVTYLDTSHQQIGHYWPELLPDGRHFLYFARNKDPAQNAIYVASLDGKGMRLLANESWAQYVASGTSDGRGPGYLLYVRERTLVQSTRPATGPLWSHGNVWRPYHLSRR
jgi:hypothetical protein